MPKLDPVTGPMSREEFALAVSAPAGQAAKIIRKYDPQFGRAPGEKFPWKVSVSRDGADTGTAYIMAANQEEADEAADALTETEVHWDYSDGGLVITSVEPDKPR